VVRVRRAYAIGSVCSTSSKGESEDVVLAKETPMNEAAKKRLAKRILAN
jgi:hypothetical protein